MFKNPTLGRETEKCDYNGNTHFWGSNLPEGVGKNGIVFETSRPDDPKVYSERFKQQIQERQSTIDDEVHDRHLQDQQLDERLAKMQEKLLAIEKEALVQEQVITEMSQDLEEMSLHQVYQKYAYFTVSDIS